MYRPFRPTKLEKFISFTGLLMLIAVSVPLGLTFFILALKCLKIAIQL